MQFNCKSKSNSTIDSSSLLHQVVGCFWMISILSILYASVLLLFWFCCVFFHFFLNPTSSCYVFPCFPATFRRKSPSKVPLRQRRLPAASPGPVPSALRHVGTARPWDPRHAAPCRSFGKPMRILKSHEKYMKST